MSTDDQYRTTREQQMSSLHRWLYWEPGDKTRVIDGHSVSEILWETPRSVVFRDPEGRIWRRVHSWNTTWPVEVRTKSAS